jgi:hypothetical protein
VLRGTQNVFKVLPPDQEGIPTDDSRHDAEINIQAALMNAFGATDNLAWVWLKEKKTGKNGKPLDKSEVGLRKRNDRVRSTFSEDFQHYLLSRDDWFDGLVDYRDALAHRIPLYIPPYMFDPKDEAAHTDLEARQNQARLRGDETEYERLEVEQKRLTYFEPWMVHSYLDNVRPLIFHPQLIANFNTVHEMGLKMLAELDRR